MSTGHEPVASPAAPAIVPSSAGEDAAPIPDRVYRLSIEQYNTMVEAGCFETGELVEPKLELLEGVVVNMSPINAPHANIVAWLHEWLHDKIDRDTCQARCQSPILVPSTTSVPEPDLSVVERKKALDHPTTPHVPLVIEVADSSLLQDLTQKASIYARGGVPEYWVVDIPNRKLHLHRRPEGEAYQEIAVVEANGEATPEIAPAATLRLAELFAALDT